MAYKVKCDRLDDMGNGIAFIDDKITFVNNFLPGEEADVEIKVNKKKFAKGEVINLICESNGRVKPKCPYLNCGCHLKHLNYEKQLEFKENKVKNILKRYANIVPKINKIIPSDNLSGYRNKITLKVNGYVGYHENESNNIITISRCELASEKMNEIIKILNSMDLSKVNQITIKEFDGIMLVIDGKLDIKPLEPLASSIYMNDILVYGDEYIETKINDLKFKVSKNSFFQINNKVMEKLYDLAISYCGDNYNKKVLDLYCGVGTITLLLSKHFKEVIGIEINSEAIKCANINKEINNISNINFICGDASLETKKMDADIIVVDPPRKGLTSYGIDDILRIGPERLVYISCDPMTLARDLNILKEFYDVMEVTPVDMFPNTYHVETVTLLIKKGC